MKNKKVAGSENVSEGETVRLTQEHFDELPQLKDKGWEVDQKCPVSILEELRAAKNAGSETGGSADDADVDDDSADDEGAE